MTGKLAVTNLSAFVGREQELKELQRMLGHGQRLITIAAPGGYGKSRLAVQLVELARHQYQWECFEVLLAPLRDHRRIPWSAAEAVGLQLRDDDDPQVQLIDFLRGRRALIHFDNFEHLLAGAGLISDLLRELPELRVLVSSREPLGLSVESVLSLGALPLANGNGAILKPSRPAAVRLFANRAALADRGFTLSEDNEQQVAAVCRELGGIPLAIELAAAWSDSYSLDELQLELRNQLDIEARDAEVPERHRSLRASCDWSYSLLSEHQQLALRCLSICRGGFSLEAAAAILPSIDLADTIAVLVDKNWLRAASHPAGPRYQMHNEAIREYAYQHLLDSDDFDVAVVAHCRYCGQLIAGLAGGPLVSQQAVALQLLNAERENIYFALETAVQRADTALQLPLVRYLQEYLLMIGAAGPCAEHYGQVLESMVEEEDSEIRMLCNQALGRSLTRLGRYEQARQHCLAAADGAETLAQPRCAAVANVTLGDIERLEGHHQAARFHLHQGLETMRALGDVSGAAEALLGLGRVAEVESDFAAARGLIGEALGSYRTTGDQHGAALCLNSLGNMAYRQGDYEAAREHQTASLELRRRLGDRWGIAQSLNNLGNVEFAECNYSAAWTLYSESLKIRRDIGERFGIAASLNNLGNVQYCEHNYAEAQQLHEEGLAIKREIGDYLGCSFSLNNLGNVAVKRGDYARAAEHLQEALSIAREVGSRECMIAPLAISCSLLAGREQQRAAAILAAGVHRQLADTGLVLDPMDGGMLAEGIEQAHRHLDQQSAEQVKAAGEAMSLADLVELSQRELEHIRREL
jgi:predicted ATPase/Tfp pilus assembly protein PilF